MKKQSKDYFITLTLRTLGNFLILTSLFFIGKTFYQPAREEVRFLIEQTISKKYVVAESEDEAETIRKIFSIGAPKGLLARASEGENVQVLLPENPDFSIIIPKIAASSIILPNVSVADKEEYMDALGEGVAHARGTAFPGEGGHIFMFAHSTDFVWNVGSYNAVFYLLYKLEEGDEINLFYKGQRFVYNVTGKEVVDPSEIEYLTRKTDSEVLTLQTCWPPGTTLKRQLVFAEPVSR